MGHIPGRNTYVKIEQVIRSFADKDAERLFLGESPRRVRNIERVALRKLLHLHAAKELKDLNIFPGNRLEPLQGDRKGQHSIRINDQWRICFVWKEGDAYEVEIVDYH